MTVFATRSAAYRFGVEFPQDMQASVRLDLWHTRENGEVLKVLRYWCRSTHSIGNSKRIILSPKFLPLRR